MNHSTNELINYNMIKINQKLKDKLWWLVISVDYDYSRITIADHDFNDDTLTLWLEDKHDFKNSLDDECLAGRPAISAKTICQSDKGRKT